MEDSSTPRDVRTLVIPHVDFIVLEEQRLQLTEIDHAHLSENQSNALHGIENMLNHWSDNLDKLTKPLNVK